jgi:hypothetical protein
VAARAGAEALASGGGFGTEARSPTDVREVRALLREALFRRALVRASGCFGLDAGGLTSAERSEAPGMGETDAGGSVAPVAC